MDEKRNHQSIDPTVVQFARFKSRQLAGKYGFARHDAADIEQNLLLDYVQRSRSFDSNRCNRRSFGRLVINNRVAVIIAAQKAACRDHRVCRVSLDSSAEFVTTPQLGDIQRDLRSLQLQLNLRLDIERILLRLPGALMTTCRLMMVCDSAVEAASRAGTSRGTLYRQIKTLRTVFADLGIDR